MQLGLGNNQINMLAFMARQNEIKGHSGRYSVARDHISRKTAGSLEKRGLISLVRDAGECWIVKLTESGAKYCQDNRLATMPPKF